METWQINLSLIPSIAVILTSSNRMVLGITDEMNTHMFAHAGTYSEIFPLKIKQLKRLSISILLMYTSLSMLVLNALLVGIQLLSVEYDKLLIFIAIVIFFIAIRFKILFSWNAYFIRQKQFNSFVNK